jgi:hypothetical protein
MKAAVLPRRRVSPLYWLLVLTLAAAGADLGMAITGHAALWLLISDLPGATLALYLAALMRR